MQVDACEGVMLATEQAIRQAVLEDLPISLLITKVWEWEGLMLA